MQTLHVARYFGKGGRRGVGDAQEGPDVTPSEGRSVPTPLHTIGLMDVPSTAHGRLTCGTGDSLIRPAAENDLGQIRAFLLESEHLYPGIEQWWDRRVLSGLRSGDRHVLVVQSAQGIGGLFIGKPGPRAKICTLRLRETLRARGLGRVLVTEGLQRILTPDTRSVHVTISEAADAAVLPFFKSLGFRQTAIVPNRYCQGVDEYVCESLAETVRPLVEYRSLKATDYTLFGAAPIIMNGERTLIMSLKPEFARLIASGRKTVEFRRRFSSKYSGATILFYVSRPICEFLFTAKITAVHYSRTGDLWSQFREEGRVSKALFDEYFYGVDRGYAILVSDLSTLPRSMTLKEVQEQFPQFRPPQSFQTIPPESLLLQALNFSQMF